MKIFIRIAFLGSDFYGTQKLPDKSTIQGLFASLLSNIYDQEIKVTISSRLDRGVHALDFALTFDIDSESISIDHLKYYLKRSVGKNVFIKDVRIVENSFSPRYSCASKQYLYLIQNGETINPLFLPFTYIPKKSLDVSLLKETLNLFKGEHDFRYFSTPEDDENTMTSIDSVSFQENGDLLMIRFKGKSFLRYQVRFMVGSMISVAMKRLTIEEIKKGLTGTTCPHFKYKAEPQGLILESIDYPTIKDCSTRKPSLLF